MARMLPPEPGAGTSSEAERKLFGRLREELPDSWTVLHSVGLAMHPGKRWAEIDFVLVGPDGVYCLEVKGGRVRREDGVWIFTNRLDRENRKTEGPFEQAGSAAGALAQYLSSHVAFGRDVPVGWGVVIYDDEFDVKGPDIEPRVILDRSQREQPLTEYVARLRKYWHDRLGATIGRKIETLTGNQAGEIVRSVRGDFDLRRSIRAQVDVVTEAFVRCTEEQYQILDALGSNDRLIIRGGAGTGKTFLAIEAAKRHAAEGRKVLFCCYNTALAGWLEEAIGAIPGITVAHLHALMAQIVREAGYESRLPKAEPNDLFRVFYPELSLEALVEQDRLGVYDILVVDEGQDLSADEYLDVLDALLRDGLAEGRWLFFMDPKQNLFSAMTKNAVARLGQTGAARYELKRNCRNTKAIVTTAELLTSSDLDEPLVDDGPPVAQFWYTDDAEQRRLVSKCINRLLSGGIEPASLVVLSRRRLENSALANGLIDVPYELSTTSESKKSIRFATIGSFKGLEADAVVLTDVDDLRTPEARAQLYVGLTRARAMLSVFLSERLRDDYLEAAQCFGERLTSRDV